MSKHNNFKYPRLHNAMWPGLVGKGSPGAEPCIDLDTMLDLTAKAAVDGIRFDGVDLFLYDPHINIDISDDGIQALAEKIRSKGFVVGSVVAPVWFDGSAMGDETKRTNFVTSVRKACRIAKKLRELGARPYGIVRIDSAASVADWKNKRTLDKALAKLTAALRPWTIDFHVAQNDATVKGSGTHDKTGRHCLATDPNGKLNIPHHAGFWLRDEQWRLTKAFMHMCWDGCMFPNEVMMKQQTWNDILAAMIAVRDKHGWNELS